MAIESYGERGRDLTIESPSVGTVQVRLLLPEAFADEPAATFPTLYLLHGGGGQFDGQSSWRTTTATDVMLFRAPVVGGLSGIFRRGP